MLAGAVVGAVVPRHRDEVVDLSRRDELSNRFLVGAGSEPLKPPSGITDFSVAS